MAERSGMEAKKQDGKSFGATYPSNSGANQFPRMPREKSGLAVPRQRGHRAVPLIRRSLVFLMTVVIVKSAPHKHLSYQLACMVYLRNPHGLQSLFPLHTLAPLWPRDPE